MYAIREDPQQSRLHLTLSGRVPSDEVLRAIRQASILLKTDSIDNVMCDATYVERGPGRLMIVAALMASEFPVNARLAIVTGEWQQRMTQRVLRFSGLGAKVRCFMDAETAEKWLTRRETVVAIRSTETRHFEHLHAESAPRPRRGAAKKIGPAA